MPLPVDRVKRCRFKPLLRYMEAVRDRYIIYAIQYLDDEGGCGCIAYDTYDEESWPINISKTVEEIRGRAKAGSVLPAVCDRLATPERALQVGRVAIGLFEEGLGCEVRVEMVLVEYDWNMEVSEVAASARSSGSMVV